MIKIGDLVTARRNRETRVEDDEYYVFSSDLYLKRNRVGTIKFGEIGLVLAQSNSTNHASDDFVQIIVGSMVGWIWVKNLQKI